MGLEFLMRTRRASLWTGAILALMIGRYVSPADGLAAALGAAWSVANLWLLERLVVALTGPGRGDLPAVRQVALALTGMLALFGAGALMLGQLPPQSLLWGFLVPFAVLLLKAASLLLIGSARWKRFSRDPRRAGGVVALLFAAAWAARPLLARAAEEEESGPQKFPNAIGILSKAFHDQPWSHFLHHYEVILYSMFVAFLLALVAWRASRNPQMIPGKFQNAVEYLVESLYDFVVGILGPKHGARYVPFLGTLFIYILAMNLFGLIPFMDSPTSSLNVTVALAITVFLYAQWIGLRELGIVGFVDHLAGNPRSVTQWLLVPLMLPIHILGEFAKPISLSCRLFGNIFGEDMLLVAFVSLGVTCLSFTHAPFGLPLQLPFLFLALLTSTLQALVFTVLSTIYFLLMLPHDEHHESHEAHATTPPAPIGGRP
jgi:F-type H+-transporting ATPase subunit a